MSYKALYRTYRPTKFSEVIGQSHIISTLENIINNDRISHAFLFAGPRGTGKTSVAHIFAKTLNCTDIKGTDKPCNMCQQCKDINTLDIVEIDAASNNGVADIRTLIENAKYVPTSSKYKVYIIDEVHMLSKGAFNALLKTLEEPPKHVVFILATTEAHKIPITILSRTQRFNFRIISKEVISKQLRFVLDKEKITYDTESIALIANLANGGMRDALSIADQAAAFSNGNISFSSISQVFGIVSIENQINLLNLAFSDQTKSMLIKSSEFIDNGSDIERLSSSLIDILKDFIIFKKTSDADLMSTTTENQMNILSVSIAFAYKSLDILIEMFSKLRYSEVPRQSFELALLKISDGNKNDPFVQQVNTTTPEQQSNTNEFQKPLVKKEEIKEIKEAVAVEIKEDESFGKIFSTQEIQVVPEDVMSPEEVEQIQEEIESTGEFQIPEELLEEENENDSNEEAILATQEVNIETGPNVERDILKMFDIEDEKEDHNEMQVSFTIDEVINLLVQADREAVKDAKYNWSTILKYATTTKFGTFTSLLYSAKIISAGNDFILVSSDDDNSIPQLNNFRKEELFIEFITLLLGKPLLLFAITKDEFEKVKQTWATISSENRIPEAKPIEKLQVKKIERTKEEEFGAKLFGDLFKS